MKLTPFLTFLLSTGLAPTLTRADAWQLSVDAELPAPVKPAIQSLVQSLAKHHDSPGGTFIIGEPSQSKAVAEFLEKHRLALGDAPESLLIHVHKNSDGTATILLAGRDPRGLSYAVWDAADAISFSPPGQPVATSITNATSSPRLRVRSVSTHLFNESLERDWYFSEAHWRSYFALLARSRFNTFILTFADQTNYMAPPFPWLLEIAEFPNISVDGLTKEDQKRNLEMLRRIGELAREFGLDFTLAIWQQQPVITPGMPITPTKPNYGRTPLKNLPKDADLAVYNTAALSKLLCEVPTITGLQLRLNDESGIPEKIQHDYYQSLFTTIKNAGRPIALELRYKGLKQETIDLAVAAGLDVTVSTKFWCEHLGLPFHPTAQDPLFSASRYGFGTMLKFPRNYRVSYQLWNQGSNRIFLWADREYAARFAESCALGEGDGFEVFAPLTNKGWGNEPETWNVFTAQDPATFKWEFERYWAFFQSYGRMGYDPTESPALCRREFVGRFGDATKQIDHAYQSASRVLPLITATTQISPSEWGFWPEFETCGSLDAYSIAPPGDYSQFYAIRKFQPVNGWTGSNWSSDHNGFIEDAVAGKIEAKWTPLQIADEFDRLASDTLAALNAAEKMSNKNPEFESTQIDLCALAYLAQYHAAKKRAATHLAFFHTTKEAGRLVKVSEYAQQAAQAWESLAEITAKKFASKLIFGRAHFEIGAPGKTINAHEGHWKDRLFDAQADARFAAALLTQNGHPTEAKYSVFPGEITPRELPVIEHDPIERATPGCDVSITIRVQSKNPLRAVILRYRTMDQTKPWIAVPMSNEKNGAFHAVIPGSQITAHCNMMYYLEARVEGGGTLWPDWRERSPYLVIKTR